MMQPPDFEQNPSDLPDPLPAESSGEPGANIEDMTLSELIGHAVRHPVAVGRAFIRVTQSPRPDSDEKVTLVHPRTPALEIEFPPSFWRGAGSNTTLSDEERQARRRTSIQIILWTAGFVATLIGSSIMATERSNGESGLNDGVGYFIVGFVLWLAGEVFGSWPALSAWWQNRTRSSRESAAVPNLPPSPVVESADTPHRDWLTRAILLTAGAITSLLAWRLNANNQFTILGVAAWWSSIVFWVFAVAPDSWTLASGWNYLRSLRRPRLRGNWTLIALLLIVIVGAYFRLNDLEGVPPEMTSDHLEKLLDSQRVLDGNPQVFFPNNGGREPFQMYAMALLSRVPGLGMNFTTLKLLSALEGILTLPVMWWMGRRIVNEKESRLGNVVGLVLAALVAVSYWHVALSRLALRIILTPLVTALLLGYFAPALRYNRRGDYIKAGLVLGFGLYTYQAVRMLPVVILVGGGLAVLFKARSALSRWHYIINVTVLALIALVVFVPLFGFSLEQPQYFWMRTFGRLLGDEVIQTTDSAGNLVERTATLEERLDAFKTNVPVLASNIRNALLMYNWKGDVAWINGAPNEPAMDIFTGTLLVVGGAAWIARMFRRRDIVDWLLPAMLFVMVLPSALSIAYPIENPSATRMSGTMPEVYLFAALPLALLAISLYGLEPRKQGRWVGIGVVVVLTALAFSANLKTYFVDYRVAYLGSSPAPYSEAGHVLQGFAESGGSYGNAFMIGYPYWWGHREIGMAAGLTDWPNGITDRALIPGFLYASWERPTYTFDPNRDILFFFSPDDTETEQQLSEWFPTGYAQIFDSYRVVYRPSDQYGLFRVPALGRLGFEEFLQKTDVIP